jgi:lysophospholipase L1-like esterase
MKRAILFLFGLYCLLAASCKLPTPSTEPPPTEPPPKVVAIGDSITMGIQDAGLVIDFQQHSYPYLVAQQMRAQNIFQQPNVAAPGIGVFPYEEPLQLSADQIIATYWPDTNENGQHDVKDIDIATIILRLSNKSWPDPYNNLGVNGAKLYDMRHTTSMNDPWAAGNYFFDIVLRNLADVPGVPNFGGKTIVQEAAILSPDYILLWIGNNDILGTILAGCGTNGDNFFYTDPDTVFEPEYRSLLTDLSAITDKIVLATIPAYLPFAFALDGIYRSPPGSLCIFDPETFEPIVLGGQYLPLMLEESGAPHLLLTGALAYLDLDDEDGEGLGIPDDTALQGAPYNISDQLTRNKIIQALQGMGLKPSGQPIPGSMSITSDEESAARVVIGEFNAKLALLSAEFGLPLVDIVESWWGNDLLETPIPFGGYSGKYAIQNEENTTFSLDGVHPNNLGHALSANAFIKALNQRYNLSLALLDPNVYKGQYFGMSIKSGSLKAIKRVMEMYAPKKP